MSILDLICPTDNGHPQPLSQLQLPPSPPAEMPPIFDATMVVNAVLAMFGDGRLFELRALHARRYNEWRDTTYFGYFDVAHADALLAAMQQIEHASGLYVTLNQVDSGLLARSQYVLQIAGQGDTTADKDVTRRLWLPIDFDPRRVSGVSATDAEKAAAIAMRNAVAADLQVLGLPVRIVADSGNGGHLLLACELPADDGGFVQAFLAALATRYDATKDGGGPVTIDLTTFNPARIWKLYGSRAAKGQHAVHIAPPRPWRMSTLDGVLPPVSGELEITTDSLAEVAHRCGFVWRPPATPTNATRSATARTVVNGALAQRQPYSMADHGQTTPRGRSLPDMLQAWRPEQQEWLRPSPQGDGRTMYRLVECPFDAAHGGDAAVFCGENGHGPFGFRCFHDGCARRGWAEFRTLHESAGTPPAAAASSATSAPAAAAPVAARRRRTGGHGSGADAPPESLRVTRLLELADGSGTLAELTWTDDGRERAATVRYKLLGEARSITALREYGLPVTSESASAWVGYFAAYVAEHREQITRVVYAAHLGWQGSPARLMFLAGPARPIVAAGIDLATAPTFCGADPGTDQVAAGFRTAGDMTAWRDAMGPLANYPRVRLAVIAALAPPLLELLEAHSFVLSFAAETSLGKTTAMRAGASCWGLPDFGNGVLARWDSTQTWLERAAHIRAGLPLIVDDTAAARVDSAVTQVLYDLAAGAGRGRGTIGGLQTAAVWRTVLLSSGERSILAFANDKAGARARVLELSRPPFGGKDAATAAVVHALQDACASHYGHAGPALVQYLIDQHNQWPAWREQYRGMLAEWRGRAGDDAVLIRLAEHLAVLSMTFNLAAEAKIWPDSWSDPLPLVYDELRHMTAEADKPAAALGYVWSWATSNRYKFIGSGTRNTGTTDSYEIAGRWDRPHQDWPWVGMYPHVLRNVLEKGGFDVDATIAAWGERGWFVRSDGRGWQYRSRINGSLESLYAITRQAIEGLDGEVWTPPESIDVERGRRGGAPAAS